MRYKYEVVAEISNMFNKEDRYNLFLTLKNNKNTRGVIPFGYGVLYLRKTENEELISHLYPKFLDVLRDLEKNPNNVIEHFTDTYAVEFEESLYEVVWDRMVPNTVEEYLQKNPNQCKVKKVTDLKTIILLTTLTNLKTFGTTRFFNLIETTGIKGVVSVNAKESKKLRLEFETSRVEPDKTVPTATEFFKDYYSYLQGKTCVTIRAEVERTDYRSHSNPHMFTCIPTVINREDELAYSPDYEVPVLFEGDVNEQVIAEAIGFTTQALIEEEQPTPSQTYNTGEVQGF